MRDTEPTFVLILVSINCGLHFGRLPKSMLFSGLLNWIIVLTNNYETEIENNSSNTMFFLRMCCAMSVFGCESFVTH